MREEDPLLQPDGKANLDLSTSAWQKRKAYRRHLCLVVVLCCAISGLIYLCYAQNVAAPSPLSGVNYPDFSYGGHHGLYKGQSSLSALEDRTVDPCNDFYEYACGGFRVQTLPPDHDEWYYTFDGTKERVASEMREILNRNTGDAGNLYRSCMNQEAIEVAGVKPVLPYIQQAWASGDSNTSFVATVAALHRINSKAFFEWNVGADADSSTQVLYMEQGGLTLPDRSYYISHDKREKIEALRTLIRTVLMLVGKSEAQADQGASSVIEIETVLAKAHLSHADERKANSLPPLTFDQVAKGMSDPGGFEWKLFFDRLGIPKGLVGSEQKLVRVLDVDYFQHLADYITKNPAKHFRWYLMWRYLDALIGHLGKKFQDADLTFRRSLYGIQRDPPRWRICMHTLNLFLPDMMGKVYRFEAVQNGAQKEENAQTMLALLRQQFANIISEAAWISDQSKRVAIKKLWEMEFEVGGPTRIQPLEFDVGQSWFQNSVHIAEHLINHQVRKMGKVLKRSDWGTQLGPMSVNAFYSVHANTLFVPAALLQEPFADAELRRKIDTRDFGSLGGLAAHEMTHGFDNVGRLFGPSEVIKNWWDKETINRYKQRADCIADYYHSFKEVDQHVHGNQTLGEDIADMGGLHIAYDAMMKYRSSSGSTTGKHLARTAKKQFFASWAETWCHIATDRMKSNSLLTDPHAPANVRVNAALSQFEPFAEAFQCPRGSSMNPIKPRCSLW